MEYKQFKMNNLSAATQMINRRCFMASVDLRHTYYFVSIKPEFRKFKWKGQLYAYTCFANGLCNCPRYFTKMLNLKPVYAHLRSHQGFLSALFIDDCFLQGQTFEGCHENVERTVDIFQVLGFAVYPGKSVLVPCQKPEIFGVLADL